VGVKHSNSGKKSTDFENGEGNIFNSKIANKGLKYAERSVLSGLKQE